MIILEASPRTKGYGAYLGDIVARKYASTRIHLAGLTYSGCKACMACQNGGSTCALNDDLRQILIDFQTETRIVLIAPNYMGFMNAAAKQVVERLYCMKDANKQSRFAEGTKLAFFMTQGSGNRDTGSLCMNWMRNIIEHYGIKFYGHVVPNCAYDNTDAVRIKEDEIKMNLGMFF
jgi:multimeric flavodoxin WrbA